LFSIGGVKWRNLRAKLTPTFTSGKMKMMFPILQECSEVLKDVLKEPASKGDIVEMKDISARFTTDIISSCAFGIQTNSLKNPDAEFRKIGRKIFEPSAVQIVKSFIALFTPKLAELVRVSIRRGNRYGAEERNHSLLYLLINSIIKILASRDAERSDGIFSWSF